MYCYIFSIELGISKKTTYILKSFNNMKINYYELPYAFDKWKEKERKKYVLDNYNLYDKIYLESRLYENYK